MATAPVQTAPPPSDHNAPTPSAQPSGSKPPLDYAALLNQCRSKLTEEEQTKPMNEQIKLLRERMLIPNQIKKTNAQNQARNQNTQNGQQRQQQQQIPIQMQNQGNMGNGQGGQPMQMQGSQQGMAGIQQNYQNNPNPQSQQQIHQQKQQNMQNMLAKQQRAQRQQQQQQNPMPPPPQQFQTPQLQAAQLQHMNLPSSSPQQHASPNMQQQNLGRSPNPVQAQRRTPTPGQNQMNLPMQGNQQHTPQMQNQQLQQQMHQAKNLTDTFPMLLDLKMKGRLAPEQEALFDQLLRSSEGQQQYERMKTLQAHNLAQQISQSHSGQHHSMNVNGMNGQINPLQAQLYAAAQQNQLGQLNNPATQQQFAQNLANMGNNGINMNNIGNMNAMGGNNGAGIQGVMPNVNQGNAGDRLRAAQQMQIQQMAQAASANIRNQQGQMNQQQLGGVGGGNNNNQSSPHMQQQNQQQLNAQAANFARNQVQAAQIAQNQLLAAQAFNAQQASQAAQVQAMRDQQMHSQVGNQQQIQGLDFNQVNNGNNVQQMQQMQNQQQMQQQIPQQQQQQQSQQPVQQNNPNGSKLFHGVGDAQLQSIVRMFAKVSQLGEAEKEELFQSRPEYRSIYASLISNPSQLQHLQQMTQQSKSPHIPQGPGTPGSNRSSQSNLQFPNNASVSANLHIPANKQRNLLPNQNGVGSPTAAAGSPIRIPPNLNTPQGRAIQQMINSGIPVQSQNQSQQRLLLQQQAVAQQQLQAATLLAASAQQQQQYQQQQNGGMGNGFQGQGGGLGGMGMSNVPNPKTARPEDFISQIDPNIPRQVTSVTSINGRRDSDNIQQSHNINYDNSESSFNKAVWQPDPTYDLNLLNKLDSFRSAFKSGGGGGSSSSEFSLSRSTLRNGIAAGRILGDILVEKLPEALRILADEDTDLEDKKKDLDPTLPSVKKRKVQDVANLVDKGLMIEGEVENVLLELSQEHADMVCQVACNLAKHRRSDTIDRKDVQLAYETICGKLFPGFAADQIKMDQSKSTKRPLPNTQRLNKLKAVADAKSTWRKEKAEEARRNLLDKSTPAGLGGMGENTLPSGIAVVV